MTFSRSFRSGLAGILAIIVIIAIWIVVVVGRCERNVSGDAAAGKAGWVQSIPFKE